MRGDHYKMTFSNNYGNKFRPTFQLPRLFHILLIVDVFVFFVDAVPQPSGHLDEEKPLLNKKPEAKEGISFQIDLVIPVNWRGDNTLKAFVRNAFYSKDPPSLHYLPSPPPSSSSLSTGDHLHPWKLQEIETKNIAGEETDKDGNIYKIYTRFIWHSSWEDDRAEKQMGLRLLSELLASAEFNNQNQKLKAAIDNLNKKLKESGLMLPPPTRGHFQLTIFDENNEERLTKLLPAHLRLLQHPNLKTDDKPGKGIFKPRTKINPKLVMVRLEVLDVKDALKKPPDAAVHFQILIPAHQKRNERFRTFVELTLRTSSDLGNLPPAKRKQQHDPVLRYVHPPSTDQDYHQQFNPDEEEEAITTSHIEHTHDKMISTGFSFHSFARQIHDEDHEEKKQMVLWLLNELLYSQTRGKNNQKKLPSEIVVLEERLAASGLSRKFKSSMGGHFELALSNEKGESQGLIELIPGPIVVVHSVVRATLLTVRLEIDARDLLLKKPIAPRHEDAAKQIPSHTLSFPHKDSGSPHSIKSRH